MLRNKNILLKIGINLILIVVIFLTRKVSFTDSILNYDETEWIYCLKKMIDNPIPIFGFDAHTTGPIAIYLLYPFYLISEQLNIYDLRIYGLIFLLIPFILFLRKNIQECVIYSFTYFTFLTIVNNDFFAYNTEWILIPLLFLLEDISKKITNKSILTKSVYILIIILLPLIKFQAILFSLYFYIYLFVIILKEKKYNETYKLILISITLSTLVLIFINNFINVFELKHFYIDRNVYYSKFMKWGKSSRDIFYIFRHELTNLFFLHIISIIITTFFLIKKNGIKIITKLTNEYILTFITLITIYIPKTNFTHYFQFLFFAFTILLAKQIIILIYQNRKTFKYIIFLFLICTIAIGFYNYNNTFEIKQEDTSYIDSKHLEKKIQNSTVFILGWFEAEPLYYRLRNKIQIEHPSAHTYFLKTFSEINKGIFYNKELNLVLKTLRSDLDYVVDPEGIIENINENKINSIIFKKYQMIEKFKKGYIYKKWK